MKAPKKTRSFRLSESAVRLLGELSEVFGLNHTAVIEFLIRDKYRKEKVRDVKTHAHTPGT
jgi:hypothetical protein